MVTILGVEIDQVTFASAIDHIENFIKKGRPHHVVTINPEYVMRAQTDRQFRAILHDADLAVPDGAGILWASRIVAHRRRTQRGQEQILTERVTGTDLVSTLAERAVHHQWKIYLLGGLPGIAKRAASALIEHYPDLKVVGAECGPQLTDDGRPMNKDQAALLTSTLAHIKKTKPDLLFVAFGSPKQDYFIHRYKAELGVPVMIGVGGAFDFLTGTAKRAPWLFQVLWLEWFWRLLVEPWRAQRIWTAVARFSWAVLFSKT